MAARRDSVDHHVDRWASYWSDRPEFRPEVEGAVTRMQAIVRELTRRSIARFGDASFTYEDYTTLHALMIQPHPTEATAAQLADATHVTRAAMTSRLDRLVEMGYVTREPDVHDRRRVRIRPTSAGRRAWEQHVHQGMESEHELLGTLSERDLTQLNALLRRVLLDIED